jgi:hypothetical protein
MKPKFYWVKFDDELTWAVKDEEDSVYPYQVIGSDEIFAEQEIEVLAGPFTEEEIANLVKK